MVKKNLCIFISGNGSNLKAIIDRSRIYNFPAQVKIIVSNNRKAKGLAIAKKNLIPFFIFDSKSLCGEMKIINEIRRRKIHLICLAGYMKILSKNFVKSFPNSIINIHPSLLPKFKGLKTYQKVLKNKEKKTGCTVHYVNEKLDCGKIIKRKYFFLEKKENEKSLKNKTQKLEHKIYSEAIIDILKS